MRTRYHLADIQKEQGGGERPNVLLSDKFAVFILETLSKNFKNTLGGSALPNGDM